jgi:hypothetical protein
VSYNNWASSAETTASVAVRTKFEGAVMFNFKTAIHEIEHSRPTLPSNDGQLYLTGAEPDLCPAPQETTICSHIDFLSGITYTKEC